MIVVDASVLFEVVVDSPRSPELRALLADSGAMSAPHLIDAEVLAVIQTHLRRGDLDSTAAAQAVDDLRSWPGERWSHRLLMGRAWELRDNVRSYDALYVALAEALDVPLLTLDARLAAAPGPTCRIVVPGR